MERLGERLPAVVEALEEMAVGQGYKSQVRYFAGVKGLEQITYNSLRAEGDLYIYEVNESMNVFTSRQTAEKFRRILVERGIVTHQLTNLRETGEYTEVEEMVRDFWDVRHVDPEVLRIKFETLIYNDVVALYAVEGRGAFGVEIRNRSLAEMQVQIFRAMQQLATPMEKVGLRGAARVVGGD
jgi:predicted transcriptional regulator